MDELKTNLLIGMGDFHAFFPALETLLDRLHEKYAIFSDIPELKLRNDIRLVFTGDYIDRKNSALKIINVLKKLKEKNPRQVRTLMGNHELMAMGDYDFAVQVLEEIQAGKIKPEDAYAFYSAYGREASLHGYNGGTEFIKEFGDDEKSQFKNYVERMSSQGDIGKWMRHLQPMYKKMFAGKKIIFTHADMPKNINTDSSVLRFEKKYDEHMAEATINHGGSAKKYGKNKLIAEEGVFWERRFRSLGDTELIEMIDNMKIDYMVTGHTPQEGIKVYGGRIFDIDVGMCQQHEPAAIVFKKDGIYGFYAEQGEHKLADF